MNKPTFTVLCLSCGKLNSTVIETQEAYVDYAYDFETPKYEQVEIRDGHSPDYYCAHCRYPFEGKAAELVATAINA